MKLVEFLLNESVPWRLNLFYMNQMIQTDSVQRRSSECQRFSLFLPGTSQADG